MSLDASQNPVKPPRVLLVGDDPCEGVRRLGRTGAAVGRHGAELRPADRDPLGDQHGRCE
ncbi:hypothetical protein ACIQ62_08845 [Streptomyces sp. NPDC096319]|uniref:hypothetical protein n=1 Tax=Streptomyces sp. NPDC096319 TaxID=3366084 RepID=UPI00380B0EFB